MLQDYVPPVEKQKKTLRDSVMHRASVRLSVIPANIRDKLSDRTAAAAKEVRYSCRCKDSRPVQFTVRRFALSAVNAETACEHTVTANLTSLGVRL